MNTKWYLGLNNKYSNVFPYIGNTLQLPYIIDEQLRENPLEEDISLKRAIYRRDDYFFENNISDLYAYINNSEYYEYMYIRRNAFKTAYGIMVLISNPKSSSNYFILADSSLIPKTRKLCYVDTFYNPIDLNRNGYYAAFFADYVMENILLKRINRLTSFKSVDASYLIIPVVFYPFKDCENDIMLRDLMIFRDMNSYNLYMLAVDNLIRYNQYASVDNLTLTINSLKIISCDSGYYYSNYEI